MLSPRHVIRLLTSKSCRSFFQESTLLSASGYVKNIPFFHQEQFFNQSLNVHTSCNNWTAESQTAAGAQTVAESQTAAKSEPVRKPLGKLEGKMKLSFTCKRCTTRNTKIITKVGYQKGVVIVRCDGCKVNHLIADNLGWFSDFKAKTNIERILARKGETVRKIRNSAEGCIEAIEQEDLNKLALESLKKENATKSEQVPIDTEISSKS